MFIEDYMTPAPITVVEEAPVVEAVTLMQRHRIRHLPVVDSLCRPIGIVTDRDLRQTVGMEGPLRDNLTVASLMTADPQTIDVKASLEEAVTVLTTRSFGALPVVEGGRLVGIFTYVDALSAFAQLLGLDQPGERLEVALPEGFADIARAFEALRHSGGSVHSAVVSRTRRDGGEPALYLRVAPDAAQRIEQRLRKATLILLEPELG